MVMQTSPVGVDGFRDKCVWVLFLICASIGSEPSDLKKPPILSSSNDVALKLTSLTTTAVRPAILYGTECWAVKSQHENKVGVAEMRMLRWMCGKTRQDKIRNEAIRERVGVAPIAEKMVENRLRWFGHVERRPVDSVVRRVDQMERRQTIRGRGRPKKTIREVIKKDLEINGLDRSMVLDRTLWRKLIHVADPT
ncbi:hypothetical protein HKD37_18G050289 [Glycine soja]